MSDPADYLKTYDEFWREVVERPDGTLNADQVKRELHDYRMLLRQVPEVYDSVTGGQVSKPDTLSHHVIDAANRRMDAACDDAINDLIQSLEMDDEVPGSVTGLVALIRELTGVQPYVSDDAGR